MKPETFAYVAMAFVMAYVALHSYREMQAGRCFSGRSWKECRPAAASPLRP
ncbi:MAG: hypothetical protein Q8N10_17265 [Phenylobacterium sp.]|uniref:hypothetical protein n=1 Tax=Phenylobacterium sp. TaxID=1871053 RepID=UPI002727226D|nr:hypothetical protein [Phenylobacterium sp.]MDO8911825.1 hypothetical protein [Phenylobacterium sp.]MDP3102239.1 hypothetical protein [Phenylobacterium sp.]MDP3869471.1 hypothetical protein [Phenylobacterium sp.]